MAEVLDKDNEGIRIRSSEQVTRRREVGKTLII